MLRLQGPQVECLWDEVLPSEVRELPEDLARIDELLKDPAMLEPIATHWEPSSVEIGRPTIPMATYVRMMVVKQRSGWGYETLVGEVSDSLHLRRFCGIPIDARVPHESTIRKLTRRLGPEVVAEITRTLISKAARERRFRPRAARIDSTVIEADIRYPSDAILALQGAKRLAREGKRLGERIRSLPQKRRCRLALDPCPRLESGRERYRWGCGSHPLANQEVRRTGHHASRR